MEPFATMTLTLDPPNSRHVYRCICGHDTFEVGMLTLRDLDMGFSLGGDVAGELPPLLRIPPVFLLLHMQSSDNKCWEVLYLSTRWRLLTLLSFAFDRTTVAPPSSGNNKLVLK